LGYFRKNAVNADKQAEAIHAGVATPQANVRHGLRSSTQKAKSQSRLHKSPTRYVSAFAILPSPVLCWSSPAEKFTARQNRSGKKVGTELSGESEWNIGGAKYRNSFLTFFY
jgi:hypothetical protein